MFEKLSWDIIREILLFDCRFFLWRNKLVFIDKIPREDERYSILYKIPRIYRMYNNQWIVILSEPISKKRFILECRQNYHSQWEYYFHVFTYNHLMRELNTRPDISICY
jgi:hypothetical protein